MGSFRVHTTKNFTIINNCLFHDKALSWKAKGLLAQMLSLPEEWDYTEKGLSTLSKDGLTSTRSALKELEEAGYLVRSQIRSDSGRIIDVNYDIYEVPVSQFSEDNVVEEAVNPTDPIVGSPLLENPKTDKPLLGNPKVGQPLLGFPKMDSPKMENKHNKELINKKLINQERTSSSDRINQIVKDAKRIGERDDDMSVDVKEDVLKQIDYEMLTQKHKKAVVDEVVAVVESVMAAKGSHVRVSNHQIPIDQVKTICRNITTADVDNIASVLEDESIVIHNRKSYIKTLLCNKCLKKDDTAHSTKQNAQPKKAFASFDQRNYDFDELERRLLMAEWQ